MKMQSLKRGIGTWFVGLDFAEILKLRVEKHTWDGDLPCPPVPFILFNILTDSHPQTHMKKCILTDNFGCYKINR